MEAKHFFLLDQLIFAIPASSLISAIKKDEATKIKQNLLVPFLIKTMKFRKKLQGNDGIFCEIQSFPSKLYIFRKDTMLCRP